jgi:hypothetical protein
MDGSKFTTYLGRRPYAQGSMTMAYFQESNQDNIHDVLVKNFANSNSATEVLTSCVENYTRLEM